MDDRNWNADPSTDEEYQGRAIQGQVAGGGNIAAFEELVGRYEDKAYRLAIRLVGSKSARLLSEASFTDP